MQIEIKNYGDRTFKVVNDTWYSAVTPDNIVEIIEQARMEGRRLVFDFGDTKTGRSWQEVYDTRGTIGRSTGPIKIPLLIKTKRSMGGGSILTDCIVKINDAATGRELYRHPQHHVVLMG